MNRQGLALVLLIVGVRQMEAQTLAAAIADEPAVTFGVHPCPSASIPTRECLQQQSARSEQLDRRAPDHRYEGLGIGGAIGAAVGVIGGFAICSQSDVTCGKLVPWTTLSFGAIGAFIGLLVGAQFPQESKEPVPPD
jgi:hypothetical protein